MASKGIPESDLSQLFSTMRRIKSYLRSTMLQRRLNYLMILSIYKEQLDDVDLSSIANFVEVNIECMFSVNFNCVFLM